MQAVAPGSIGSTSAPVLGALASDSRPLKGQFDISETFRSRLLVASGIAPILFPLAVRLIFAFQPVIEVCRNPSKTRRRVAANCNVESRASATSSNYLGNFTKNSGTTNALLRLDSRANSLERSVATQISNRCQQ